ncbi:MAG: spore germination protein, partial [Clostridia bacterium]|nr:spore germination protein [Clostridia bacterium]
MTQSILQQLLQHYNNCDDVKIRTVCCGEQFSVVLLETMCNDQKVCDFVLHPLLMQQNAKTLQDVEQQLALSVGTKTPCNFFEVLSDFSNGYTLVFDQEGNGCVAVDTRIALGRAVIEPPTSMVMRGPREGFVEDAKSNVTLLRKRLKTPNFKVINLCVGKFTNTLVSVYYLENVADK